MKIKQSRNVLGALLLVLACGQPAQTAEPSSAAVHGEREFLGMVLGKTSAEVSGAIGEPAKTERNNDIVIWYYQNIVEAMSSKKVFGTTQIVFMNDKASEVMNTFR
ncbi:MAG: hypothetical protein ACREVE_14290 [Gammaproteobacteria bacterium]